MDAVWERLSRIDCIIGIICTAVPLGRPPMAARICGQSMTLPNLLNSTGAYSPCPPHSKDKTFL